MQYNILQGAEWHTNTTDGNVSLEFPELYGMLNYDNGPMTSLSGTDVLTIDFDLGTRIHLNRFEYKYVTPYASLSDVASGIEFYYKDEDFDNYNSLPTYYTEPNLFYTTISGGTFAPRYLRLKHTVANTLNASTISGAVYGFKAFNDDTTVDFGTDGTANLTTFEIVREDPALVATIPIFNSGSTMADAYINLEPSYTGIDEAVSISTSANGPWTYVFDPTESVADVETFDYGLHYRTDIDSNILRIEGIDTVDGNFASPYETGTLTTRVFARGESDYNRFVINNSETAAGYIAVDRGDPVETMEIRSSKTKPVDYLVLIEFYDFISSVYHYYGLREKWPKTWAIKNEFTEPLFEAWRYSRYAEHTITFDPINENYAGCVCTFYDGDSRSTNNLYLFRNNLRDGTNEYVKIGYSTTYNTRMDYSWIETKLDSSNGMWIHFRSSVYSSGYFIDNKGFYLAYFDSDLNNTFKYMTTDQQIYSMSSNYITKELWYTRPNNASIYKISHLGTVIINYSEEEYTYDLGGICVLPDGNLLFADGKNLHRLNASGYPMPEYTLENVAGSKLTYIGLDSTDSNAIWAIDGTSIGLLYITGFRAGEWDFKISITFPLRFDVTGPGVWVQCVGETGESGVIMRYVSKETRRVEFEYLADDFCQPALQYQDYTHRYYTEKMPIASDTIWPGLAWQKVNVQGHLANEDTYFQIRTTLRRQEAFEKYPNTNVTSEIGYITDDYFNQGNVEPYYAMWGDWLNYPALDRVHINTTSGILILENDADVGASNAYISSEGRMQVGIDSTSGKFEIRVGYTIGVDSGVDHGKTEDLYIYAYPADEGKVDSGKKMGVRFQLTSPVSSSAVMYILDTIQAWDSITFSNSVDYYSGEIALYWDGTTCYGSIRKDTTGSWVTWSKAASSSIYGEHFYVRVEGGHASSQLKINYITFPYGNTYVYTDTPRITSINKQQLIKLPNIYPNTSKNIYLRSYVPRTLSVDPENELDLKVRWRIPVY